MLMQNFQQQEALAAAKKTCEDVEVDGELAFIIFLQSTVKSEKNYFYLPVDLKNKIITQWRQN